MIYRRSLMVGRIRRSGCWSMTPRAAVLIAGLLAFVEATFAAGPKQFKDFPVSASFEGRPANFDDSTAPKSWAAVRPIIKKIIQEGMAKGPNFAGVHYLATVGCGSGCEAIFVIDLRDGRIHRYPEAASNGVVFQKDSRLIILREDATTNRPRVYLVFENGKFNAVK